MTVRMKEGDTSPAVEAQLTDANDNPVDLGDVDSVNFQVNRPDGEELFSKPVAVSNGLAGEVSYEWDDGDADEPGDYRGQFVIEYSSGETMTTPTSGWIDIFVERR